MMNIALSIVALLAAGLTLELVAAAQAPLGYQDESGFHFGTPNNPGSQRNLVNIRSASRINAAMAPKMDPRVEAASSV